MIWYLEKLLTVNLPVKDIDVDMQAFGWETG
jgi:hypothetical protein